MKLLSTRRHILALFCLSDLWLNQFPLSTHYFLYFFHLAKIWDLRFPSLKHCLSIHFNHAYNYSRYLAWVFHLVDVYIFIRLCIIGHEGRCSLCLVARFQRFLLLIKRLKDLSDRMRGALSRNTGKKYWVSKWVFKFERKPEILKNDLKRKLHFIGM